MKNARTSSEHIRVRKSRLRLHVQVELISWPEVSRPTSRWHTAGLLPRDASSVAVARARRVAFGNPRYFATCVECDERLPRGCMCGDALCQGCAQANHGVVY